MGKTRLATELPWALRFLVVREIGCWDWVARIYMPAHQHCELLNQLVGTVASGIYVDLRLPQVIKMGKFEKIPEVWS